MDQLRKINKVFDAAEKRVEAEVAALLGVDFSLLEGVRQPVTKQEAFDGLSGKQVCSLMEVTGEINGLGCLLIGIKDAIRLGGTLIMLPSSELDEVIGREEYSEEVEDSYGEIANIIAGAYTKEFEDNYSKQCRIIRKEQSILVPTKVDPESAEPINNELFYQLRCSMVMEGRQLGEMVTLLPAAAFGLQWEEKAGADAADPVAEDQAVLESAAAELTATAGQTSSSDDTDQESIESSGLAHPLPPKFNRDKHLAKVEKLLAECQSRMAGEIGALTGTDVELTDLRNRLVTKEIFFSEVVTGKQVLSQMDVVGDLKDTSYLCIGKKAAIYLGGVLIMLPPTELDSVVGEEDFSEDCRDAYGEIANIISGVYTAIFEEQYVKSLRFIRKESEEVSPVKVEMDGDEPIPNKLYYLSTSAITVDGKSIGDIHLLCPAALLYLQPLPAEPAKQQAAPVPPAETVAPEAVQPVPASAPEPAAAAPAVGAKSRAEAEKHRKKVDKLLKVCMGKVAEETGALLGTEVACGSMENRLITKDDFFMEEVSSKQVFADLEVAGQAEGKAYLSISLKDAIRIGGELIMLPASELETAVSDESFGDDTSDAYGEIANIIAGVYTAVFEEQYTKAIRFVRKDFRKVTPLKVDVESDEPCPDGEYYLSSMLVSLKGETLGRLYLLVPLAVLDLEGLGRAGEVAVVDEQPALDGTAAAAAVKTPAGDPPAAVKTVGTALDILLIGDDEAQAASILEVLAMQGYQGRLISFKDSIHSFLPGKVKAVYLVTREVNEQAFGMAIKIGSSYSVPLIAAAPGWTRSKVIKAVKYGIRDILLTPADELQIAENIANNLVDLAA